MTSARPSENFHTNTHACTHTHTHTHMYTCTRACTHTYIIHPPTHWFLTHTHTYTHACMHTNMHIHTSTHTHKPTYQFLQEIVSVLAVFQWTHFPAVIHHIRTQQYLVITLMQVLLEQSGKSIVTGPCRNQGLFQSMHILNALPRSNVSLNFH